MKARLGSISAWRFALFALVSVVAFPSVARAVDVPTLPHVGELYEAGVELPPDVLAAAMAHTHLTHEHQTPRGNGERGVCQYGSFDLVTTNLEVVVNPGVESMFVIAEYTGTALVDGVETIDLRATSIPVTGVTSATGEDLDYYTKSMLGSLHVETDHPLVTGESYTFKLVLNGSLSCEGGLVMSCDFDETITYVTSGDFYPTGISGCDLTTGVLKVTAPAPYIVAGTGTYVGVEPTTGGFTYSFDHVYPTNFYSFAVAPYEILESSVTIEGTTIPITSYHLPVDASSAQTFIDVTEQVLPVYSDLYAPYPWNKIDIIEIGEDFGGGYGPLSTVMVTAAIYGGGGWMQNSVMELQAHELGHQWWGNFVNLADWDQNWLSEGFAEFSACYFTEMYGNGRGQTISDGLTYLFTVADGADAPVSSVYGIYSAGAYNNYTAILYYKGMYILEMLRHHLGDEVFFQGMAAHAEAQGMGFATIYEYMEVMSAVSGEDLSWFFDQWVYSTGHPSITAWSEVTPSDDGDGWITEVTLGQEGNRMFKVKVPVLVYEEGKAEPTASEIMLDDSFGSVTIETATKPLRVTVDRTRTLLRILVGGTPGDVNLSGEVDGLDVLELCAMWDVDVVVDYEGMQYFMPNSNYSELYDQSFDGSVDQADLDVVLEHFGK